MDDLDLAKLLRHEGRILMARMEALDEGPELEACRAVLRYCSGLLLAAATGDRAMRDELLAQGEAAARLLHPERDKLN